MAKNKKQHDDKDSAGEPKKTNIDLPLSSNSHISLREQELSVAAKILLFGFIGLSLEDKYGEYTQYVTWEELEWAIYIFGYKIKSFKKLKDLLDVIKPYMEDPNKKWEGQFAPEIQNPENNYTKQYKIILEPRNMSMPDNALIQLDYDKETIKNLPKIIGYGINKLEALARAAHKILAQPYFEGYTDALLKDVVIDEIPENYRQCIIRGHYKEYTLVPHPNLVASNWEFQDDFLDIFLDPRTKEARSDPRLQDVFLDPMTYNSITQFINRKEEPPRPLMYSLLICRHKWTIEEARTMALWYRTQVYQKKVDFYPVIYKYYDSVLFCDTRIVDDKKLAQRINSVFNHWRLNNSWDNVKDPEQIISYVYKDLQDVRKDREEIKTPLENSKTAKKVKEIREQYKRIKEAKDNAEKII